MLKTIGSFIKYWIKNKNFQIGLNIIFILINIILLVFLFLGLKEKDIKKIKNNKFRDLLHAYKYTEALYQILLALYGFYSLYKMYKNKPINDILSIIFLILTCIFIILKSILIFIIYSKYINSNEINKDIKINIILSLVMNCILFSIMFIIIIFQIYYYQENSTIFDFNELLKLLKKKN